MSIALKDVSDSEKLRKDIDVRYGPTLNTISDEEVPEESYDQALGVLGNLLSIIEEQPIKQWSKIGWNHGSARDTTYTAKLGSLQVHLRHKKDQGLTKRYMHLHETEINNHLIIQDPRVNDLIAKVDKAYN